MLMAKKKDIEELSKVVDDAHSNGLITSDARELYHLYFDVFLKIGE